MSLESAIDQVLQNYEKLAPKTLDINLFASFCSKELKALGIPYYKFYQDKNEKDTLVLETPFLLSCRIEFKSDDDSSPEKLSCHLIINGKPARKIKVESLEPEYLKKLAYAMLDWFKRFSLFISN